MRQLIAFACLVALTACGEAKDVVVTDSWVRMPAAPGRPAAGYFIITGGATDQTLVAVSSPASSRVELHETMKMDGQMGAGMTMKPLAQLRVPAGQAITFAPGGKHLMLFDIAAGAGSGKAFPLTFRFADGRELTVQTRAILAGDPPPQF